ncbi:nucleoside 2-deoxyribosyltransferase [Desulfovibrio inopinatus]|uniref:nucleoside 2-deoxyribosyltransferase n=1 Tax=Desulfovibrio inopinatus TaxID=102109 RepID=UPI00040B0AB9|nr:nucleoside 2-deoxyribosyltransferase [Desulfovibrio inopinatus]
MKTIYQAGPLFTEAEQQWHRGLKKNLETLFTDLDLPWRVVWPFELFPPHVLEALADEEKKHHIWQGCIDSLRSADMVIALLDGTQVDDGTAFEVGYFKALNKGPIYGIRTDFRNAGDTAQSLVNCMIESSLDGVFRSQGELMGFLAGTLAGGAKTG